MSPMAVMDPCSSWIIHGISRILYTWIVAFELAAYTALDTSEGIWLPALLELYNSFR